MPFHCLFSPIGVLLRAFAVLALCISFAHAADGPGLLDSLGKLLTPARAVAAPAAANRTLAVSAAGQGRRIALVIGNADYQHADNLPRLANPAHDAEDIAEALRGFGFEVIERKNQTLEGMSQAVAEFGSKLGGSEAALFYFAGHGIQVKNQNYLMPVSARIESEAAVPFQGFNVNQILEEMDNGKSRANIVMLDACRNNPISGKFRSGGTRGLASPGNAPQGTVIVYATDPGNVAADGEGRNGMFTAGLLTAFKGGDLSLDGVLTVASEYVEQESLKTDPARKQTPYVNGPKTLQKNFHFRVTVDPGKGEIEKTFWTSIERSTDAADFEAYLRKYPKGSYRALAENRLKQLKPSQPAAPASVAATKPAAVAVAPAPSAGDTASGSAGRITFAPPVQAVAVDAETDTWSEVKKGGTKEYFEVYLKDYPKGKYAGLARAELKKLDERDKAERAKDAAERKAAAAREQQEVRQAEQEAWEQAKAAGTAAAYADYLGNHPNGRYASLAQAARQKAQREAEERAKQEAARLAKEAAEMRPGKAFKDCADCPEMVILPAGSFEMGGTTDADETPVHRVSLKAFAMGKTEATQGQWRAVMGSNPSHFSSCGDSCPVEKVSWDDAKTFIQRLNAKTGKSYRLPSEAEWEYACRAGGRDEYCGSGNVDSVAWYGAYATPVGNSAKTTNAVARKQANAWGLYDMSGNVWEWTEDCWNGSYSGAPTDGSAWTSGACGQRVTRGGSWNDVPQITRSSIRSRIGTSIRSANNGFRLARMLP